MSLFDEYLAQDGCQGDSSNHYDEHTDRWIDEASETLGHSGHCDVHTDEK